LKRAADSTKFLSDPRYGRATEMLYLGLMKRRNCLALTWLGWIALFVVIVGLGVFMTRAIHPFLALNYPVQSRTLVVEGWLPDYALEKAIVEFKGHNCTMIITTGGPLERGFHLEQYKTNAELAAATLRELGFEEELVVAVPAPSVIRDRTYAAALALRDWLSNSNMALESLNLYTLGPHARRSRLIFRKALGKEIEVGVIAADNINYDPLNWWKSSRGVRTVFGEMIAYLYARFFFHPTE
jgi:hypothetical protein